MLSRRGVAKLKASGSKPTLGFYLLIPPTWQALQVAPNNRFPRFTCSGVKTIVFPDPSATTVLVASSKSIADAVVTKALKTKKKIKEKSCE
jgi:hypothetical protein